MRGEGLGLGLGLGVNGLRFVFTGAVGLGIEVTKQHIKTQNFYRERLAIAPSNTLYKCILSFPPYT